MKDEVKYFILKGGDFIDLSYYLSISIQKRLLSFYFILKLLWKLFDIAVYLFIIFSEASSECIYLYFVLREYEL